jgi:peptidoglycan hydrolase-like protein with peptidoglycan-binding domain
MGAAGARAVAVVAAVALAAFVASGCETLTSTGLAPTSGHKGSNASHQDRPGKDRKPVTKSEIAKLSSLFKGNQTRLSAGPAIMQQGSSGDQVRDLQARLKWSGWFDGPITGRYGGTTAQSVRRFQAKRRIPITGEVDQRTLDRLRATTRTPGTAELYTSLQKQAGLDRRCMTGRVVCISKRTKKLVWVVHGTPTLRMDVRFGSEETPTREGSFVVSWKSRKQVSSIYHTPMPYSMFFSGGQAIHYSADFAARGYNGASYGCVNVRDLSGMRSLYDQVQLGDRVIVYR